MPTDNNLLPAIAIIFGAAVVSRAIQRLASAILDVAAVMNAREKS